MHHAICRFITKRNKRHLFLDEKGSVMIMAAILLPLIIFIMAAQINYGMAQLASVRMNNAVSAAQIITRTPSFSVLPLASKKNSVRIAVMINMPVDNATGIGNLYGNQINQTDINYVDSPTSKISMSQNINKIINQ